MSPLRGEAWRPSKNGLDGGTTEKCPQPLPQKDLGMKTTIERHLPDVEDDFFSLEPHM
jgi:hypothetical protein